MHQIAATVRHLVAIGVAVFIACSTALPAGIDLWLLVFDAENLVTARFIGRLAFFSAFFGGLALAVLAWRRRHRWISRLSLPLVGYALVCGIGLMTLVVISQAPHNLVRVGLGELRPIVDELDVRHIISYFGFAVVAAIAWQGRVGLPGLGVLLMAYGFGLEVVQEWVPGRNFRIKDVASNGLGIALGLCWVYLYDSLFGAEGTGLSRLARRRLRRRALVRRASTRAGMQPGRS